MFQPLFKAQAQCQTSYNAFLCAKRWTWGRKGSKSIELFWGFKSNVKDITVDMRKLHQKCTLKDNNYKHKHWLYGQMNRKQLKLQKINCCLVLPSFRHLQWFGTELKHCRSEGSTWSCWTFCLEMDTGFSNLLHFYLVTIYVTGCLKQIQWRLKFKYIYRN